jgi:hypothetical protein
MPTLLLFGFRSFERGPRQQACGPKVQAEIQSPTSRNLNEEDFGWINSSVEL